MVHVTDIRKNQAYLEGNPALVALCDLAGARTIVIVPMLKGADLVGTIAVYRQAVRPFTDRQIELLSNFAKQAVIAIENTRLLNELRQRTDDLTESLEQQTATSEVLQVISSTPGDLDPVFKSMLENATRICGANFGQMNLYEGGSFRPVAFYNMPAAYTASWAHTQFQPHPQSGLGTVARTLQVVHTEDIRTLPPYLEGNPSVVAISDLAGARTYFVVPMLKENELIGAITIYRQEVKPFTVKQIELVANFANQAVIAIENARLLKELRQRTEDLTESLERQTATSEVLKVISSSPGDMEPVFEAILSNALRICEAKFGHLLLYDGDSFEATHLHDVPPSYREYWEEHAPIRPGPNTGLGRLARSKQVAHIPDLKADSAYAEREPLRVVTVEQAGARSFLAVPMLKENKLIGAIVIYRKEVRPFTEKQIELVQNFAAQAVIAIENTRLLRELRESLQQQTATADVLKIISSSPGELEPVFHAMLENATRICEAKFGTLYLSEGDGFRAVAMHNAPPAYKEARAGVVHPSPYTGLWRAAKTKQVVQIADVTLERGYIERDPVSVSAVELAGYRSILCVPMLHEDKLIGVIIIFRQEVRPFTDKQIELLTNFAAQAVIAIENTRLLRELRESLQQQTATRLLPRRGLRRFARIHGLYQRDSHRDRSTLGRWTRSARGCCGPNSGCIGRSRIYIHRGSKVGPLSNHPLRSDVARRRPNRRSGSHALRGPPVYQQANRARDYVRRPGSDRDRKCAAVR